MKQLFYCLLLLTATAFSQNSRPNILWIVSEDLGTTLSMYGDATAKTPNLNALAQNGVVYDNAFAAASDSGPSRSAIYTGMLPSQIGTMHMRTGNDVIGWSKNEYGTETGITDITGKPVQEYSAVTPYYVKFFTEYLRAKGYYCTNNVITDYQFAAPLPAWDDNSSKSSWKSAPKGTPFFSVFSLNATHESRLWANKALPLTTDTLTVPVPPYLPDMPSTRRTVARHYSNIELLDAEVGAIINALKADGLYDNTIIFFYSTNGGPLPRQKREVHNPGTHVPLIIKVVNSKEKGRSDRLVSLADLAPTMLSLVDLAPPAYMQGTAFMGKYKDWEPHYIFATADRFEEFTDRIRSVRTKNYLYIRNYYPELPRYKDISYRKSIPMMPEFKDLGDKWELNEDQLVWFKPYKALEELYDCRTDPYNLHNIAARPDHSEILSAMRAECKKKFDQEKDFGSMPESEMIAEMWPGGIQPKTVNPEFEIANGVVTILKPALGVTYSYIISSDATLKPGEGDSWQVYTKPFNLLKGQFVYMIATRIGYRNSGVISKGIK